MAEMTVQEAKDKLRIIRLLARCEFEAEDIRKISALLEQQQAEIERLTIREHRLTEYMRDVKNYALTLREVSQNAIDEGEAQIS